MAHTHQAEDGSCSSHTHENDDAHAHQHSGENSSFKAYKPALTAFILLMLGLLLDFSWIVPAFKSIRLYWYLLAYLPVALPVLFEVWETFKKKEFFTEFSLMFLATVGAFAIGQYPEAVAVMLFYTLGELFQEAAVAKAKHNIKALLAIKTYTARVFRNDNYLEIDPDDVKIGEKIQVKAGEKVPLDAYLLSADADFNAAALTGESTPKILKTGEMVLAGMINNHHVVELKVAKIFKDSTLARILHLVQNAVARKAKTELFIRKFAKFYTPFVFFMALAVVIFPFFILGESYSFQIWLYRALVFLVISCPCALVISIPLGYFGGIGAASAHGMLFKGANFLDTLANIDTVVFDKTGTLTEGDFKVVEMVSQTNKEAFMGYLSALEVYATHPIAKAIVAEFGINPAYQATQVTELPGLGIKGLVNENTVMVGNMHWFNQLGVALPNAVKSIAQSLVLLAVDGKYLGHVILADELKADAEITIKRLKNRGIKQLMLLSGDQEAIVQDVAKRLNMDMAFGALMPEDKVAQIEALKRNGKTVAFVGDGINDTPVLALSDVGMAMGALGSDAAIETADVVIQTDQLIKVDTAISIAKATKAVVWQNIFLAFAVKAIVLILGAGGLATMWEAVFADVGVALLAILNAIRIQKMKFD